MNCVAAMDRTATIWGGIAYNRDVSASREGRRPCDECGRVLGTVHGNTRYHPACAALVQKRRAAEAASRYRSRKRHRVDAEVPPDATAGRVTIPGIALSGADVSALRASALKVIRSARQFDALLGGYEARFATTRQFVGLHMFLSDVLWFAELLDELLPLPEIREGLSAHAEVSAEVHREAGEFFSSRRRPRRAAPRRGAST